MIYPADTDPWSEAQLQMYVAMEANRRGLFFHSDGNGANKGAVGGSKMKLSGARKGWPDLTFICPGYVVFIEMKTMDGKLSKDQLKVHSELVGLGHIVRVVYAKNGRDAWNQVRELIGGVR